jgi:hypothetical protein
MSRICLRVEIGIVGNTVTQRHQSAHERRVASAVVSTGFKLLFVKFSWICPNQRRLLSINYTRWQIFPSQSCPSQSIEGALTKFSVVIISKLSESSRSDLSQLPNFREELCCFVCPRCLRNRSKVFLDYSSRACYTQKSFKSASSSAIVTRELVQGPTSSSTGNRSLAETGRLSWIHILKERLSDIGSKSPLGRIMAMKLGCYCVNIIKCDLVTQQYFRISKVTKAAEIPSLDCNSRENRVRIHSNVLQCLIDKSP